MAAFGLELVELLQSSFELIGEAEGVHAENCEGSDLFAPRCGDGKVQDLVFERGDAVQSPRRIDEELHEVLLEEALRLQLIDEGFREALVSFEVLGGHNESVASEGVAHRVQRRALDGIFAIAGAAGPVAIGHGNCIV
jgi:hypothetical protein